MQGKRHSIVVYVALLGSLPTSRSASFILLHLMGDMEAACSPLQENRRVQGRIDAHEYGPRHNTTRSVASESQAAKVCASS